MSHRTEVFMIADQFIKINGEDVWIHKIKTIIVNGSGLITEVYLKDTGE